MTTRSTRARLPPLLGPSSEAQRLLGSMPLEKLRAAAQARGIVVPARTTRADLANRLVLHAMQERSEIDYRETGNPFDSREAAYEPIARVVRRERLRHLLDIGSGPGLFAAVLRERDVLPADGTYLGIDRSPAAIELARARVADDPRYAFAVDDAASVGAHLHAAIDGIVLGFVLTFLDTHTAHRLFATTATACPDAACIIAFTFLSAVDRLEGTAEDEAADVRAARRFLRGDRKVAAGRWDVARLDCYRRSFEQYYVIEREQILAPLAQVLWTARPRPSRGRRRMRSPRKPART